MDRRLLVAPRGVRKLCLHPVEQLLRNQGGHLDADNLRRLFAGLPPVFGHDGVRDVHRVEVAGASVGAASKDVSDLDHLPEGLAEPCLDLACL